MHLQVRNLKHFYYLLSGLNPFNSHLPLLVVLLSIIYGLAFRLWSVYYQEELGSLGTSP